MNKIVLDENWSIGLILIVFLCTVLLILIIYFGGMEEAQESACMNYSTLTGIETKYERSACYLQVNGIWVEDQEYFDYLAGRNE